ncbi:hypothetical protein [Cysteiniphilum litorale]|uniref:DUF1281 family ferredoxin-like fold protein n=1 Tax=Cysteiniphilum litorale TaxID=2056700 RepID=UPI003F880CC6
MPNWCNNKLILNADKKSLDSLLCEIHKHNCLFDFLCPLPNDIVNNQEWTRENWGTKWNVHLADLDINRASDNDVSIGFDTAWTPPVAFIKTLINAYPTINFKLYYFEDGMGIAGIYFYQDNIVHDISIEPNTLEYFRLLVDVFGYNAQNIAEDYEVAPDILNKLA